MKCSVEECQKEASHTVRVRAATSLSLTSRGMTETDVHLCNEHRDDLIKGKSSGISMGCSIKDGKENADTLYRR